MASGEYIQNCTNAVYSIDSKWVVKRGGQSRKAPLMGYSCHCLTQVRSCVGCWSAEDLA